MPPGRGLGDRARIGIAHHRLATRRAGDARPSVPIDEDIARACGPDEDAGGCALSSCRADAAQPARGLGARPRPRLVGSRAGHPPEPVLLIAPTTRVATIGSCFASELAAMMGSVGIQGGMHPGGLFYSTADHPPGARAHRRRLARACGGAGLAGQRRLRRPVPRLRHDPARRGDAGRQARRGRHARRRAVPRRRRRRRDARPDRDVARCDDRQHLPPDPPSRGLPDATARVPSVDGRRDAGRPGADPSA